ncbi:hypothetical protein CRENBAI_009662 [Crenichthys baileyi]|uniref:Uncharacterized protein n=1 Tax=Crenichthys baileyi TaxID=28760 RepID=A0AAV9R0Q7_9TELE
MVVTQISNDDLCLTVTGIGRLADQCHKGCCSLSLKELSSSAAASCIGWETLSNSHAIFARVILSPTTCTGSRGYPRTELTFLMSLTNHFLDKLLLPTDYTIEGG